MATKAAKKPPSRKRTTVPKRTPQERIIALCRMLDIEMDGVQCPASASAILNGIRSALGEIDYELDPE